ncbi:pyridoxamine 5'-phosphate oxidase family protein [Halomonas sp. C05BenzN]|uniref:pyridoxamine 5'-phosphate oxidase family protein n=1 Tax=Halomonas sp. C05BenzN TaxID=3411041 RepID=UPI003B92BA4E
MTRFNDSVETREQLRAVLPEPSELVTRKCLSVLDRHCGRFIRRSPFMLLASADAQGNVDISPKGDPEGFVKILDARTLAIPDRPGNHRADTMENILTNPKVGLIFLIPGKTETLRVSGTATITREQALLDSMAIAGRSPKLAILVRVEEAFFHCSKCMIRSKLWQPEHWPDLEGLPRLAQTMVDAGNLELTENEMHRIVINDERERLY